MADETPIRPPNISPELWRQMSPEDQQAARVEVFGPAAGPQIGGFAPAPPAPPPPTPTPRQPQATQPTGATWAYVRALNSFPGNHPYFDADRAAGVSGYMLEAHDPYLVTGAQACRAAGFDVGVWSDPHGEDARQWAADLIGAAHTIGASAVAPDPESTGKGYPGSPGWQWNADAAAAIRSLDPSIKVIVTPTPNQDDFNYAAWTSNGALVWVQLYGEKLTDLYNAADVINRVKANGVPASLIGALIPAGAVAQYVEALTKLGVTHWAVYTIDDVTAGDRAIPFGAQDQSPPDQQGGGSSAPSPQSDLGLGAYETAADTGDDSAYDIDTGEPAEPDDFELDSNAPAEPEDAPPLPAGDQLRFLAAASTPPHGGVHDTAGLPGFPALDLFAAPFTRVLAPVDALVYKLSGHDPATGWHPAPGGAFGWSIYLKAEGYAGTDFYITHLQTRSVRMFQRVKAGQVIGTVGNMIGRQPHIHVGVHGGSIGPLELLRFRWFRASTVPAPNVGRPVQAPEPTPAAPKMPARNRLNKPWNQLMQALDPELHARSTLARQLGRTILSRVQ